MSTGTDDTLHTPHVFPHIIEDTTSNSGSAYKSVATSFISATSVITENGRKKPRYSVTRLMSQLNYVTANFFLIS